MFDSCYDFISSRPCARLMFNRKPHASLGWNGLDLNWTGSRVVYCVLERVLPYILLPIRCMEERVNSTPLVSNQKRILVSVFKAPWSTMRGIADDHEA